MIINKQNNETMEALNITISNHGTITFKNSANNFFVVPREIKEELNGSRVLDSLRFAARLLSLPDAISVLRHINYPMEHLKGI